MSCLRLLLPAAALVAAAPLSLDQWQRHVIDPQKPWRALFIAAADLDGDGRKDIVSGGWWYRNPGSAGGAWTRHDIGSPLHNMVLVADLDNDGRPDILGSKGRASEANPSFVWARNEGGGKFTVRDAVTAEGDFIQGIAIARFSKGGPLEIALSWHKAGFGIQMITVPAKPAAEPWKWRRIAAESQDEQLSAGDIDRDGRIDLLTGTRWLRNEGANWTVHTLHPTPGDPDRNRLADINRDGRLDAVVGFEAISVPGKLAWYAQGSSATGEWKENIIADDTVGPMSLDVADMDGDGDLDVVAGEHHLKAPETARLHIFENLDGRGARWARHVASTGDEHHDGAVTADMDGDGDLDVISLGWGHPRILLYENRNAARKGGRK